MLITGNRINDSRILTRLNFFDPGVMNRTLDVELRDDAIGGEIVKHTGKDL